MIPTVSLPVVQAPNPVQTSFFTGVPSDAAIGRIPFQSVPATIAVAEVNNQSRGNGQGRQAFSSTPSAAEIRNAAITQFYSGQASSSAGVGFSSLFLAQLFGQSNAQSGSLMQSFLGSFSPTQSLDYETMMAFSRIKYKPSNASAPRVDTTPQPITQPLDTPANAQRTQQISAMQQAIREFQTNNSSSDFISRMSQSQSNPVLGLVSQMLGQSKPQPQKTLGLPVSLIRNSQGASSYAATMERNAVNLVRNNTPQIRVEL